MKTPISSAQSTETTFRVTHHQPPEIMEGAVTISPAILLDPVAMLLERFDLVGERGEPLKQLCVMASAHFIAFDVPRQGIVVRLSHAVER